jgi:hypothetical protein
MEDEKPTGPTSSEAPKRFEEPPESSWRLTEFWGKGATVSKDLPSTARQPVAGNTSPEDGWFVGALVGRRTEGKVSFYYPTGAYGSSQKNVRLLPLGFADFPKEEPVTSMAVIFPNAISRGQPEVLEPISQPDVELLAVEFRKLFADIHGAIESQESAVTKMEDTVVLLNKEASTWNT